MTDFAPDLWQGDLPDPAAPARAFAARVAAGDYAGTLDLARRLAGHGLDFDLDAALARWDGSIDLALVAVDLRGAAALDDLAARVRRQNRRFGALAWACWGLGLTARARAAVDRLDPATDTAGADRLARLELAILDCDWPMAARDLPALDAPPATRARLMLRLIRRRDGPAAVKDALPALAIEDAGFWRQVLDHFLAERDFTPARAALDRFCALSRNPDEIRAARVLVALDSNDPDTAARRLDPARAAPPWTWTARTHAQHLRLSLMQVDAGALDPQAVLAHARAALRIHPRHALLHSLWLTAFEATGDWSALERHLCALPPPAPSRVWPLARALARIGRQDVALDWLEHAQARPDAGDGGARLHRAIAIAEMRRDTGDLAGAATALAGPIPPAPADLVADLAQARAELALWRFDAAAARTELAPLRSRFADRMGPWMLAARAAFLDGDAARAQDALDRFNALKAAQTGQPPRPDLRDRIVADALAQHDGPGAAAQALFRAQPAFVPADGPAIPRLLSHYWEGPRSGALDRSLSRWAGLHPGFKQTEFGPDAARAYLQAQVPGMVAVFDAQTLPAGRADVFRAAVIARSGGIFADVDEYPRAPVTDWLRDAACVLVLECGHATVANNFIAARPGLALFERVLERIAQGPGADPYPWWDSGPAVLTRVLADQVAGGAQPPGLRLLTQAEYCARVATNLPFPHKRGPLHWR